MYFRLEAYHTYPRITLPHSPMHTQSNTVRVFDMGQHNTQAASPEFPCFLYYATDPFNTCVTNGIHYATSLEALDADIIDSHVFMLDDAIMGFARIEGA